MSVFKVSLVCWQHGGRCVECLFGCEARDGGQRTSQPHLTSRSVPGLETSEPGRGCDEARLGEAAPIRGRGSKGSPPNTPSSNRIREMTIGNTIWDACLLHVREIKKGYRNPITEMSSEDIFDFCISMRALHWQFMAILNPSSSHTQFAMVNIWGNLIKM